MDIPSSVQKNTVRASRYCGGCEDPAQKKTFGRGQNTSTSCSRGAKNAQKKTRKKSHRLRRGHGRAEKHAQKTRKKNGAKIPVSRKKKVFGVQRPDCARQASPHAFPSRPNEDRGSSAVVPRRPPPATTAKSKSVDSLRSAVQDPRWPPASCGLRGVLGRRTVARRLAVGGALRRPRILLRASRLSARILLAAEISTQSRFGADRRLFPTPLFGRNFTRNFARNFARAQRQRPTLSRINRRTGRREPEFPYRLRRLSLVVPGLRNFPPFVQCTALPYRTRPLPDRNESMLGVAARGVATLGASRGFPSRSDFYA